MDLNSFHLTSRLPLHVVSWLNFRRRASAKKRIHCDVEETLAFQTFQFQHLSQRLFRLGNWLVVDTIKEATPVFSNSNRSPHATSFTKETIVSNLEGQLCGLK
jgi:hypothetical protein